MRVVDVRVSRDGPVSVRVADGRRCEGIVALVWRFGGPRRREGVVGEISRECSEVPLGSPDAVAGRGFLIDGFVVPAPGATPAPYQVVVTLLQNGRAIHQAVPLGSGSGTVGPDEIRFRYAFRIRA